MKTDFMIALTQMAAERSLPREVILRTIELALVSTFKKSSFAEDQDIRVEIVPQTGEVRVHAQKKVVEKKPADPIKEISLTEAKKIKKDIQIGEMIEVESTPDNAGRIAAQAAKQVILQRLREVERDTIYGEFSGKEGEVVSGTVSHIEPKHIVIDLGRAEATLPLAEQIPADHYRIGQRLKLYLMRALRTNKGTQLIVSRTHPNLLRRLFELEVPEIHSGIVELKALAREPGYRNKIAVAAKQEGVDAVGCCVGLRSIRIQNITKELNDEKIDIVLWNPDPAIFIANALSPAPVSNVIINEIEKSAIVVVPDKKLSLAIGKGGQNARLAARLTGWRIDIKSLSTSDSEKTEVGELTKEAVTDQIATPVTTGVEYIIKSTVEDKAPVSEEAARNKVVPAIEKVTEPIIQPKVEEIVPTPAKAKGPASSQPKVDSRAPVNDAPPPRVYSVEEILKELEVATENLKPRSEKELAIPKNDPSIKKGKRDESFITDLLPNKGKPKASRKRPRIIEEDDDTD